MSKFFTLDRLKTGDKAVIRFLCSTGSMRRRLLDIGLTENTHIECVGKSPNGSPLAFFIRGAVIAIRKADCQNIIISSEGGPEDGN